MTLLPAIRRGQPQRIHPAVELTGADAATGRRSAWRWVICGLLVLVSANNYLDRQVLGVLAPELIRQLRWSAAEYAAIVFWFQIGFAVGFPLSGWFVDRVGTRWGFAIAVTAWTVAAGWHGAVSSLIGFKVARFALGVTQPSNMPAGVKTVAQAFAPAERALAMGWFKGGANLGAILVPLLVPVLYFRYGWRATFVAVAATGIAWVALWLWLYRAPHGPAAAAVALPPRGSTWGVLLRRRETWAYMNFKFMTDGIWHWYLAMVPLFLSQRFTLNLTDFGLPLVAVYGLGYVGSVAGGWISSRWIARGWDLTRARKLAMLLCCLSTVPVLLVTQVRDLWVCVGLIGLAHGGHQGLTSNLFSAMSEMYPSQVVGRVIGLGGMAAQVGAALMTLASAWVLHARGELTALFYLAGTAYMVAFAIFHLLVPRLAPVALVTRSPL